jgi:hypothetical protein
MNVTPRGSSILTSAGVYVDPLNFQPHDYDPAVAAHAVSHINRFTGHSEHPWSVGQHTLLVHDLVAAASEAKEAYTLLWALVHDLGEAYLGDLARPIKQDPGMVSFVEAEQDIMRVICDHYGLEYQMPGLVEKADTWALCIEALHLFPKGSTDDWEMPSMPIRASGVGFPCFRTISNMTPQEVSDDLRTYLALCAKETT